MTKTITIKRLTIGSVIKLVLIGYGLPLFIFIILCAVSAAFGADAVKMNHKSVTGANALLAIPVFAIVWIIIGALSGVFAFIGLWLYSLMRPLKIDIVE